MKTKQELYDLYVGTQLRISLLFTKSIKKRLLKKIIDNNLYFDIPIYIVSYNRLDYLKNTVNWLKEYGYNNIIIIDNKSTLPELIDYYKTCGCKVIMMKKNYGYKVFYDNIKFFFIRNTSVYALTDPDLEPIKGCPKNFMEVFVKTMYKYPQYSKVGFSLKYDDLPDFLSVKDETISMQEDFHNKVLFKKDDVCFFNSQIDTTFALNTPLMAKRAFYYAIRVGEPYQLRHLPWYEEKHDEYYLKTKISTISKWYDKEIK